MIRVIDLTWPLYEGMPNQRLGGERAAEVGEDGAHHGRVLDGRPFLLSARLTVSGLYPRVLPAGCGAPREGLVSPHWAS